MNQLDIIKYYSNQNIQNAMLAVAKDREVVGSLRDGRYLKRPDVLIYPKDIVERVKQGVTTFHCSVERWFNPMQLSPLLKPSDLENLRMTFDLIIDIDSKTKLEHAAITAKVICEFLKDLGAKPSVKFSGNRGFHIGISAEALPDTINFKRVSLLYPYIPQTVVEYISEKIKDYLLDELIAHEGGVASLVSTVEKISELSPYEFVTIEKNWGSRHLFRMPYSLHAKSWLVSLPIKIEDIEKFDTEQAKPENVKTGVSFLVNRKGESYNLLSKALEWKSKQPKEVIEKERSYRTSTPIPVECFPPCIKQILRGLRDGKKRSLFTLITFLKAANWNNADIENIIKEWNTKNIPPLSERLINTQLKWHFRQSRNLMPPNSDSDLFYKSIGIDHVPGICGKNPVNDAFKLFKNFNQNK